jgi:hypothetical protein
MRVRRFLGFLCCAGTFGAVDTTKRNLGRPIPSAAQLSQDSAPDHDPRLPAKDGFEAEHHSRRRFRPMVTLHCPESP